MVYLALTPEGVRQAVSAGLADGSYVWIGADGTSEADCKASWGKGLKISRFVYPLANATTDVVAGALDTIAEHHPGQTIWVEARLNGTL
jgi:hypothetical protein